MLNLITSNIAIKMWFNVKSPNVTSIKVTVLQFMNLLKISPKIHLARCRILGLCLTVYILYVCIYACVFVLYSNFISQQIYNAHVGCQQDEPSASLVATNRIYNVYKFTDVVYLFMYDDVHCFLLGIKLLLHVSIKHDTCNITRWWLSRKC